MATINKVTVNNFTGNPQVETPFPIYSTQYNTAVDQINANTTGIATAQAAVDALEALNMTAGGTTNLTDTVKVLVSLTSANLLAMYATPITVLAAPGAGKAWRIKSCVIILDSTVTAYANGGVIYLSYNNTTPITNNVAASFLTAGDKVFTLNPLSTAASGVSLLVDTKVTITNDTAAFITGTGVVRLLIEADVVTTGL